MAVIRFEELEQLIMAGDYVILSTQRTGSSWLMDMLNNVEGSECHGELFLSKPIVTKPVAGCTDYDRYIERKSEHGFGIRPFSVFSYLRGLYAREGSVGFRLMYGQAKRYPEILLYLMVKRLKIIHLVRDNLLDIVISGKLGEKTGRAHDTVWGDKTEDTRVRLNPGQTVAQIRNLENSVQTVDKLLSVGRFPSTRIAYEALLSQPDRFEQLVDFLSLAKGGSLPGSNLVKRQGRPHSESIENYREIEKALSANGYGHFL